MTFIVAIQLRDSIVIAIDNKHLLLKDKKLEDDYNSFIEAMNSIKRKDS